MSGQLASSLRAIKPHIPLIKFRKGGLDKLVFGVKPSDEVSEIIQHPAVSSSKVKTITTQILEDWQVPASYKRVPLTQEEIEFININHHAESI